MHSKSELNELRRRKGLIAKRVLSAQTFTHLLNPKKMTAAPPAVHPATAQGNRLLQLEHLAYLSYL
jgi:hypothetical protein